MFPYGAPYGYGPPRMPPPGYGYPPGMPPPPPRYATLPPPPGVDPFSLRYQQPPPPGLPSPHEQASMVSTSVAPPGITTSSATMTMPVPPPPLPALGVPVFAPSIPPPNAFLGPPPPVVGVPPVASPSDADGSMESQMDSTIRKENGEVPTFEEYLDFKRMLGRKDWKRLFGRNPTFKEYIEYYDRKDSINWMKVCGMVPTFHDYMEFLEQRDNNEWFNVCQVVPTLKDYIDHLKKNESFDFKAECGKNPRFKDYMTYYKKVKKAKDWAQIYGRQVTYVDYLSYTRELEEKKWEEFTPLCGDPGFEDYLDYVQQCDEKDWEKDFGAQPSFAEYMQIKELRHSKNRGLFNQLDPTLHHLMEFKEHKKSRDWIDFCGCMPTLEDFLTYECHQDSPFWQALVQKYNDKPYFTDYMKFLQIRTSKDWVTLRGGEPSFNNFLEYLCRRQAKNWKQSLGQVPSFNEFIEYLDHSNSAEWKALGDNMPSFLAFMGYKMGVRVKDATTAKEEKAELEIQDRRIIRARSRSRSKRSRSYSPKNVPKRSRQELSSRERSHERRDGRSRIQRSRSRSRGRAHKSRTPVDHRRQRSNRSRSRDPHRRRSRSRDSPRNSRSGSRHDKSSSRRSGSKQERSSPERRERRSRSPRGSKQRDADVYDPFNLPNNTDQNSLAGNPLTSANQETASTDHSFHHVQPGIHPASSFFGTESRLEAPLSTQYTAFPSNQTLFYPHTTYDVQNMKYGLHNTQYDYTQSYQEQTIPIQNDTSTYVELDKEDNLNQNISLERKKGDISSEQPLPMQYLTSASVEAPEIPLLGSCTSDNDLGGQIVSHTGDLGGQIVSHTGGQTLVHTDGQTLAHTDGQTVGYTDGQTVGDTDGQKIDHSDGHSKLKTGASQNLPTTIADGRTPSGETEDNTSAYTSNALQNTIRYWLGHKCILCLNSGQHCLFSNFSTIYSHSKSCHKGKAVRYKRVEVTDSIGDGQLLEFDDALRLSASHFRSKVVEKYPNFKDAFDKSNKDKSVKHNTDFLVPYSNRQVKSETDEKTKYNNAGKDLKRTFVEGIKCKRCLKHTVFHTMKDFQAHSKICHNYFPQQFQIIKDCEPNQLQTFRPNSVDTEFCTGIRCELCPELFIFCSMEDYSKHHHWIHPKQRHAKIYMPDCNPDDLYAFVAPQLVMDTCEGIRCKRCLETKVFAGMPDFTKHSYLEHAGLSKSFEIVQGCNPNDFEKLSLEDDDSCENDKKKLVKADVCSSRGEKHSQGQAMKKKKKNDKLQSRGKQSDGSKKDFIPSGIRMGYQCQKCKVKDERRVFATLDEYDKHNLFHHHSHKRWIEEVQMYTNEEIFTEDQNLPDVKPNKIPDQLQADNERIRGQFKQTITGKEIEASNTDSDAINNDLVETAESVIKSEAELLKLMIESPVLEHLSKMACVEMNLETVQTFWQNHMNRSSDKGTLSVNPFNLKKDDAGGESVFTCDHCSATFKSGSGLVNHLQFAHQQTYEETVWRCFQCGWDFSSLDAMLQYPRHIEAHDINLGPHLLKYMFTRKYFVVPVPPYKTIPKCMKCPFSSHSREIRAMHDCGDAKYLYHLSHTKN